MVYLERQFVKGMTWANYGKRWHIDHFVPLASFDLATEEGRRRAWHYTNLRPLLARENLTKNANVPVGGHQALLLGVA